MSIELHTLKLGKGSRTTSFRIGRGNASGRGTTAGKGTKGQRARSGGRNKLKLKGIRAMMLSFPKNRGFRSAYVKAEIVTLERLAKVFTAPGSVDLATLKRKGLIHASALSAKIIGKGELNAALKISGVAVTAAAKALVEKAGGSVKGA